MAALDKIAGQPKEARSVKSVGAMPLAGGPDANSMQVQGKSNVIAGTER